MSWNDASPYILQCVKELRGWLDKDATARLYVDKRTLNAPDAITHAYVVTLREDLWGQITMHEGAEMFAVTVHKYTPTGDYTEDITQFVQKMV